ncbi:MAG: hypothetical protein ACRETO_05835 [Gammaproteobacteria bacterium]
MIKRPLIACTAIASMLAVATAFAAGDTAKQTAKPGVAAKPAATATHGDAAKQIATAEIHAQMAAASKDINMIHAHLHHVINCLVGPQGKLFDSKAEDPCKGMGNGALNDLAHQPGVHANLDAALETALRGTHEDKYPQAHAAATRTAALLKDASKNK